MEPMGPIQLGLLTLLTIPVNWPSIVIDLKDCLFSILLYPSDMKRFTFTVPSLNKSSSNKRYEWIVLPQGMANSPTMCQIYVNKAIEPIHLANPQLLIYHYMDDILLAHKEKPVLEQCYNSLLKSLERWGLFFAIDKVQMTDTKSFLGSIINATMGLGRKFSQ